MSAATKTCTKCGETKPLERFHRCKKSADGRRSRCADCCNAYFKTEHGKAVHRRHWKSETGRKQRREWSKTEAGLTRGLRHSKRHRELQPTKTTARDRAKYALRTGRLVRQPCRKCGDPKTQMHHHDYAKPLDVDWLCRPCHMEEHQS